VFKRIKKLAAGGLRAESRAPIATMEPLESRQLLSLVGATLDFPILTYNSTGVTTYNAATQAFDITATPLLYLASNGAAPQAVAGVRSFEIHAVVDNGQAVPGNAGTLVGGVAGDDFKIIGDIDLDGNGSVDVSGVLLTGEIERFGYLDIGAPSLTDKYDFVFRPTGGLLLGNFLGQDIGVTVTSEHSSFANDFSVNFTGGAKGNVGATTQIFSVPPKILVDKSGPTIAHAGDVITYTYDVTNPIQQDPLSQVTVFDDKAGQALYVGGDTNNDGFLETGETWHFAAQYTLPAVGCTTTPITNTAIASGVFGPTTVTAQDTYTLNPYTLKKQIYLFSGTGACGSGSVLYSQTDNTAFSVEVTKDGTVVGTGAVSQAQGEQLWLADGSYTFTEVNLPDGYEALVGSVAYTTGVGAAKGTLKNLITYDLAVDKSGPATATAGQRITYTYTVTNNGPAAVTPVLSDDKTGAPVYQSGDTNNDGLIQQGEEWLYTAQYTVPGTSSTSGGSCYSSYQTYSGCQSYCTRTPTPTTITNIATVTAAEETYGVRNSLGGDTDLANNTDKWTVTVGGSTVTLGSIAGNVYKDCDNDGHKDYGELGLAQVKVILTGTNDLGETVYKTTLTDCNGAYKFSALRPGVYSISHVQPQGYTEGKDAVGSLGGALVQNVFKNIVLASGAKGVNYDFAELKARPTCGDYGWNWGGGCGGSDWNWGGCGGSDWNWGGCGGSSNDHSGSSCGDWNWNFGGGCNDWNYCGSGSQYDWNRTYHC
jgi:hypothetical protein